MADVPGRRSITSRAGEGVADQAEAALGMETLAVERHDAGGFLTAVLKRMQAKRGDGGRIRMTEDAEHAAFLTQAVSIGIERRIGPRSSAVSGHGPRAGVHRYRAALA